MIHWGGKATPMTPFRVCCLSAARKKSYLLVLGVSSRRAADLSPTQHAVRRADSIGIISTVVGDNTPAIGTTCGRPVWLRCHGLTVGVGKWPDCLQENGRHGRHVGRTWEV